MEREVDELTKQRDDVAGHLAQMRKAFGAVLPDAIDAIDGIGGIGGIAELACGVASKARAC